MSRVDIPEEERADFYLYVDEFQNFATESFADILSEARKYHLNLIIGHQYIGQLETGGSTKVRDAVFGNVGTIACFRVGAADAEFLVSEFEPIFTEIDLVNLTKYNIYLKLMIDGVASQAFSATTLPPSTRKEGNAEKIIKVSRERYATDRKIVEERISKWSENIVRDEATMPQARFFPKKKEAQQSHQPFKKAFGEIFKQKLQKEETKQEEKPRETLKPGQVIKMD